METDDRAEEVIVMMHRVTALMITAVLLGPLTACDDSEEADKAASTVAPTSVEQPSQGPFHAVPAGSVFVSGTVSCTFSGEGGAATTIVDCEYDMSDPRVTGAEHEEGFVFLIRNGQPEGMIWVANEATLTGPEGTWRGRLQGTDLDNSGSIIEAHYIGEGAYEGLEYHYYLASVGETPEVVHGWISGGG